jgi:hypothetical protein
MTTTRFAVTFEFRTDVPTDASFARTRLVRQLVELAEKYDGVLDKTRTWIDVSTFEKENAR